MNLKKIDPKTFEYRENDRLVVFQVEGNIIHYEDGPVFQTARSHEAMGGSQEIQAFIKSPYPWIDDYPGLHQLICAELIHLEPLNKPSS